MRFAIADFCAPDPLGCSAPKSRNTAVRTGRRCMSSWPVLTYKRDFRTAWSGVVKAETAHPDHKVPASIGLVRVVRVVRALFNIIHMRARARIILSFFCINNSSETFKTNFIEIHPDHPDQASARADFRLDHHPDRALTTLTTRANTAFPEVLKSSVEEAPIKTGVKWSEDPIREASVRGLGGGN